MAGRQMEEGVPQGVEVVHPEEVAFHQAAEVCHLEAVACHLGAAVCHLEEADERLQQVQEGEGQGGLGQS